MKENIFFVPRIPLDEPGLCAHATIESMAKAFDINHIKQRHLHVHVSDPEWGTEPEELEKMAKCFLKNDHFFSKENWTFNDVSCLFNSTIRVGMILDVTDSLERINKVTNEKVTDVDGHYIILASLKEINNKPYGLIIDPSKEEIVIEGENGIINTSQENVYFIPYEILDTIWIDDKKNGLVNDHWALVMVHPDDNPSILDELKG